MKSIKANIKAYLATLNGLQGDLKGPGVEAQSAIDLLPSVLKELKRIAEELGENLGI